MRSIPENFNDRDASSDGATLARFPKISVFCRQEDVSRATVARLVTAGHLKAVKAGRSTRIDRETWNAYLAAQPVVTSYRVNGRAEPEREAA